MLWTGLSRKISLVAAARSIIFVMKKLCLLRQIFVVTKVLSKQKYFVVTNIILSQQNFRCGKHTFVATKDLFCHDKRHVAAPASDRKMPLLSNQ